MVIWMFSNDGDILKVEEFLHFYRLRKSKDPGYWEFKPWDRSSRLVLDSPSSLRKWKTNFFFVSRSGWEFQPGEDLDETPRFFRSWGTLVSAFARPRLKKRYHHRVDKVKEYLETIKEFDELISPQSLFLHFLGPEPSTKVQKNPEVVKKSKCAGNDGMTTRFSRKKLAETQEKKAKDGFLGGLLSRKHQKGSEIPKDDPMVTSTVAQSLIKRPASPTSSLELIASTEEGLKARATGKASTSSF